MGQAIQTLRILIKPVILMRLSHFTFALLLSSLPVAAAETPAAPDAPTTTLTAGSPVKIESLAAAKWLQGAAPTEWVKDEIYVFESWATWCGPCIAAIPHMEELHQKYGSKGLHIHGMNVMDQGEAVAAAFVKKKGNGMTYPVAWVEKETGAFEKDWLKPARVTGIPHTFVVANGNILFTTHPMSLTDEVVEKLLKGGADRDEVSAKFAAQNVKTDLIAATRAELNQAIKDKNVTLAKEKLAAFEKIDPTAGQDLTPQVARVEIAKLTGEGFNEALESVKAGWILAMMVSGQETPGNEWTKEQMTSAIARLEVLSAQQKDLQAQLALASLNWQVGNKDAAKALIQEGIEMPNSVVTEPLKRLLVKMEAGELPTMRETLDDIRASQPKSGSD